MTKKYFDQDDGGTIWPRDFLKLGQ
jgi:hypothetical protein